MPKQSFEEFKEKNESYYRSLAAKYRFVLHQNAPKALSPEENLELAMRQGYEDECFVEELIESQRAG